MIEFGQPIPGRDYRPRPSAYGVLVRAPSDVLIVVTPNGARYLPGGGIDAGETPERAVIREFSEETGMLVSCQERLGHANQFVHALEEPHGYQKCCTFFVVRFKGSQPAACAEHQTMWLALPDAETSLQEAAHRWAIRQVIAANTAE